MKINLVREMISCLIEAEFGETKSNPQELLDYLNEKCNEILFALYKNPKDLLRFCNLEENTIYEIYVYFGVFFTAFRIRDKNYLIGPVFLEPFSEYETIKRLKKAQFDDKYINQIVSFGSSIPNIELGKVNRLAMLLHREFSGLDSLLNHRIYNFFENSAPLTLINQLNLKAADIRKIETRYEISHALEEAVKQGNYSMAINILSQYNFSKDFDARNESPLRNIQNYCIVLNTQLRLAVEQKNVHPYQLDKISNEIGFKIEKLESFKAAMALIDEIIKDYCHLVQNNQFSNFKPLIRLTVEYIKDHLSEKISVKETAKSLGVNADYLSFVFHNDMKMTFIEFLNNERIKQAAELLKYSTLQIQEIAFVVGFNNTSYFSKQFQKKYGTTPRNYRNNVNI